MESKTLSKEAMRKILSEKFELMNNYAEHNKEVSSAIIGSIATIIGRTFAPVGRYTYMVNDNLSGRTTKDGANTIRNYIPATSESMMIANMLKIATNNIEAGPGDGTTSVVLFINALFNGMLKEGGLSDKLDSGELRITEVESAAKSLLEHTREVLSTEAKVDNMSELMSLLHTSLNGNTQLMDVFTEAFELLGVDMSAKIDDDIAGKLTDIVYDIDGARDTIDVTLDDTYRLQGLPMSVDTASQHNKIHNIKPMYVSENIVNQEGLDLLSGLIKSTMTIDNDVNGVLVVLPIMNTPVSNYLDMFKEHIENVYSQELGRPLHLFIINMSSGNADANIRISDFCAYASTTPMPILVGVDGGKALELDTTRAVILAKTPVLDVSFDEMGTAIHIQEGTPTSVSYNLLVKELRGKLSVLDRSSKEYIATSLRLNKLKGKHVKVSIGGLIPEEVSRITDMFDDAITSMKSAIRYGVVGGMSTAIPKVLSKTNGTDLEQAIKELVCTAMNELSMKIMTNSSIGEDTAKEILDTIKENYANDGDILATYDVIEREFSTAVLNSAETELSILEVGMETCLTLLGITQITFTTVDEAMAYKNAAKIYE